MLGATNGALRVLRRRPGLATNATFHQGRTCHNCGGTGRSPSLANWYRHRTQQTSYRCMRERMFASWIAEHGTVCPGFERRPHEVAASELTLDHVVPLAADGDSDEPGNLAVLCRSCNSRKSTRRRAAEPGCRRSRQSTLTCCKRSDASVARCASCRRSRPTPGRVKSTRGR
jgi:5-methylcytosine-specific restriction protein A